MSFNQAMLIGRVGKDAEITQVGSATVAKFSLATSERWKDKNGDRKESTEWHNIEVWGKMAEAVGKWIESGREVCVVGKIVTQSWGEPKKYKTVIRASEINFIGNNKKKEDDEDGGRRGRGRSADAGFIPGDPDDDIPF